MVETASKDARGELELNADIVKDLLVRFIRDETQSSGFQKGVIGVSGGVDSAVSVFLAAEALGRENAMAVIMPYKTSSSQSVSDAELVVKKLGVRSETVDISPMVDAYCERWSVTDRIRRGNVMARMRMIVLYDISARERALVIGTSNKTELMVGYGTLYGDTASAINPLGDLYKTQVWALARKLDVPSSIIEKTPTADLWEGQSDEAEMGFTYTRLDSLLYRLVDERRTDQELLKLGFEEEVIRKVKSLIEKNQFKRRLPLIAKVSYRTIGVDFRYVRDWGT
jgi:NAD+ synthase